MNFRARNDYTEIDISDADFVLTNYDENDDLVHHELPEEVLAAIAVLRVYAQKIENSVA